MESKHNTELKYDKGTILIENLKNSDVLQSLSGVSWDPRVGLYRAPGFLYYDILTRFLKFNIFVKDNIATKYQPLNNLSKIELRSYQQIALDEWLMSNGRGIICLPTGGGKTLVAISAISKLKVPTLCVVPTRVLLHQWYDQIKKYYNGPVGLLGDKNNFIHDVTIATYESAYRHISRLGKKFNFLIIDEAHHFGSNIKDEILEMSTAKFRLGLTATPPENNSLKTIFKLMGPIIYELKISDLAGKYLANYELFHLHLELNIPERKKYESEISVFRKYFCLFKTKCPEGSWEDFAKYASKNEHGLRALSSLRVCRKIAFFNKAKEKMLYRLLSRHKNNKILIFTSDAITAYEISKKFLIMPITSDVSNIERKKALENFKLGHINVLVACRVLNEGFDVPDADIAIIVGGSLGYREHVQRIGRVLRPASGKKAIIYELISKGTLEVYHSRKRGMSFEPKIIV